ncbi:CAP domain-containing protein [Anabaena sp. UHCC 0253]|uniref:CAP domain-containing protein n=1 Tax=Anabaena sp. UHCC 0253 TaxID=2590019 RepID=UPI001445C7A6|nr:CAP domain-containing protein [Anabaena sp. UHCC 0253]MTJ53033.1 CAP domain-containing protein [Anabaena sp. UHCC 0253]
MLRQTAFGIALSTLVLGSGFMNAANPGKSDPEKTAHKQHSLNITSQASISKLAFQPTNLEKSVFIQINEYRASQGLQKLNLNEKITQQARIHSQNMANGKVPFSHNGFEQRVKAIPLKYDNAAENVAFNMGYSNPAQEAVSGWLKSPGHLKNIQGKYNLTGIGVATNNRGEVYLTQIFLHNR